MRTKVTRTSPEKALMRILNALAQETMEASDEEVLEVAMELRMDLSKNDSAAFAGLTYFARPQLSEFFEEAVAKPAAVQRVDNGRLERPRKGHPGSRRQSSTDRKLRGGK